MNFTGPFFWICVAVMIWLVPVFYARDLKRPRGFGAWTLWLCWLACSAFFSREPLMSVAALWPRATGTLVFALAYSWWGRPHRRAWLAILWSLAAAAGIYSAAMGSYDAVRAGLIIAALGGCAGIALKELPENGSWALAAKALPFLYLASALIVVGLHWPALKPAALERLRLWEAGWSIAAAAPVSGVGPGLFERGHLLLAHDLAPGASWSRFSSRAAAHCDLVGSAAETGLVGLALLLVAVAFSWPGIRLGRLVVAREWERGAASGAFWFLAFFSLVEDVLGHPALVYLWFTALACAAPGAEEEEARPFRLPRPAALAGAALCALCAWPQLYARGASSARLERALALAPQDPDLLAETARRGLLLDPAQIGSAADRLAHAIRNSPRNAVYPYWNAKLYRAIGAPAEARLWAGRAIELEPEFAAAHRLAAELLLENGDRPAAEAHAQHVRRIAAAGHQAASDYERRLLDINEPLR